MTFRRLSLPKGRC